MAFEDDLRRKMRWLSNELEQGSPAGARHKPKLRRGAAGLGLAISIGASVAIFAQLLPSKDAATVRPAAGRTVTRCMRDQYGIPGPDIRSTVCPDLASPYPSSTESPPPLPTDMPPPSDRPTPVAGLIPCRSPEDPHEPPPGVRIAAEMPQTTMRRGETVKLGAKFKNEQSSPVQNDEGNPRADFVVYDASGTPVWIYSDHKVFTQELNQRTYAPGEEASVEWAAWDGHSCQDDEGRSNELPAGTYTLRAVWAGRYGGASPPLAFQIR